MIAWLSGMVRFSGIDAVCLDVGGVGYRLLMPFSEISRTKAGQKLEVYVHTHVREDAISLYGFLSPEGLALFERLLSVQGVGPRMALALLSGLEAADLVGVIVAGDEARLTKVPGVGKKTAARIVLELQEKLQKNGSSSSGLLAGGGKSQGSLDDVRSALLHLGYKNIQIDAAVQKIKALADNGGSVEDLVRAALQHVG